VLDGLHRGPFAPRPGADHHHIKLKLTHCVLLSLV
jgi:hypothetical protein